MAALQRCHKELNRHPTLAPLRDAVARATEQAQGVAQQTRPTMARMASARAFLDRKLKQVADIDAKMLQLNEQRQAAWQAAMQARSDLRQLQKLVRQEVRGLKPPRPTTTVGVGQLLASLASSADPATQAALRQFASDQEHAGATSYSDCLDGDQDDMDGDDDDPPGVDSDIYGGARVYDITDDEAGVRCTPLAPWLEESGVQSANSVGDDASTPGRMSPTQPFLWQGATYGTQREAHRRSAWSPQFRQQGPYASPVAKGVANPLKPFGSRTPGRRSPDGAAAAGGGGGGAFDAHGSPAVAAGSAAAARSCEGVAGACVMPSDVVAGPRATVTTNEVSEIDVGPATPSVAAGGGAGSTTPASAAT